MLASECMPEYSYYKKVIKDQRLPLAFVDMDLLDENIQHHLSRRNGKKIRIASKSIRARGIMDHILRSDDAYQGIMSFTAEEALFLNECRMDDILVAYPTVHIPHIRAVAERVRNGAKIWLMINQKEHIDLIAKALEGSSLKLPVCVDIDMSVSLPGIYFGVYRSSIRSLGDLKAISDYARQSNVVDIQGLMGYEAQIAGVGDEADGKTAMNLAIKALKRYAIPKISAFRKRSVELLEEAGWTLQYVNGGGTGSMESTCAEDKVTEVTVGSGFYHSHLFDHYSNFKGKPAAAYAVAISRQPKRNMYTCLGGGYIASGATDKDKTPIPYLPKGCRLVDQEGTGEVQTPVEYSGKEQLALGDPIFFRHSKAGELCERFNELVLIRNGNIESRIPTYRGEGKCFL